MERQGLQGRPQDIHGIAVNVPRKSFSRRNADKAPRKCRLKPGQVATSSPLYSPPPQFLETKSKRFFFKIIHRDPIYSRCWPTNSRDSDIRKQNLFIRRSNRSTDWRKRYSLNNTIKYITSLERSLFENWKKTLINFFFFEEQVS